MKYILVCEDKVFLKKLITDFKCYDNQIVIFYEGWRINNISHCRILNNELIFNRMSFLFVFKLVFYKKHIITEYSNFIPRIISVIFFSKLTSIIYGNLSESNFSRSNFKNKLTTSLFADHFIVVNRKSTFQLLQSKFPTKSIEFYKIDRVFPEINSSDYVVFIGQPWEEIGFTDVQVRVNSFLSELNSKFKLVYVFHPRETNISKIEGNISVLKCFPELFDHIKKFGKPRLSISVSSSLLLELMDYGLVCKRLFISEDFDKNSINYELTQIDKFSFEEK